MKRLAYLFLRLSTAAVLLLISSPVPADMYVTESGKVGIGVSDPAETLQINGSIRGNRNGALRISTPTGYTDIGPKNKSFSHFSTDRDKFYFNRALNVNSGTISSYDENLKLQTAGTTRVTIKKSNGNLGIGLTSPQYKLDVNGTIQTNAQANAGHHVNLKALSATEGGQVTLNYGGRTGYGEGASTWNIDVLEQDLRFFRYNSSGQAAVLMKMSESGPVEIFGNLRVHGQVTWPDRVFKKGYRLRTLEEVEEFVGRRKHLPDIPSEEEVAEQGVTVMDMFAKQLQKIEELTLYMIKLKKENKRLKKRMAVLEEKVNALQQQ